MLEFNQRVHFLCKCVDVKIGGKTAFLCALQSENKNAAMFFVDCGADLYIEDAVSFQSGTRNPLT